VAKRGYRHRATVLVGTVRKPIAGTVTQRDWRGDSVRDTRGPTADRCPDLPDERSVVGGGLAVVHAAERVGLTEIRARVGLERHAGREGMQGR